MPTSSSDEEDVASSSELRSAGSRTGPKASECSSQPGKYLVMSSGLGYGIFSYICLIFMGFMQVDIPVPWIRHGIDIGFTCKTMK